MFTSFRIAFLSIRSESLRSAGLAQRYAEVREGIDQTSDQLGRQTLARMAGFTDTPPISRRWLRIVLIAGPAVFLAIGLAGFAVPGTFLAYPAGFAKPIILIIEAAMTPSIAAALALLLAGPPERKPNG